MVSSKIIVAIPRLTGSYSEMPPSPNKRSRTDSHVSAVTTQHIDRTPGTPPPPPPPLASCGDPYCTNPDCISGRRVTAYVYPEISAMFNPGEVRV